jgi:hypothetical protein
MENNKIKYCGYIQNWNGITNVEKNVLEIEKEFISHGKTYKIINSSNTIYEKENWINVGDIWYQRSFYEALKDFDFSNDYFLFITGDFKSNMWQEIFEKSDYVLNKYLPKSFSGYHDNGFFNTERVSLGDVKEETSFEYSALQDGIFVFYHKDIVKELLEYFGYIEKQGLLQDMKYGWGVDFIAASICFYQRGYMIKDKTVYGKNVSSGVANSDMTKCEEEAKIMLESFKDFYKTKGIEKDISFIIQKIKQRVGYKRQIRLLSYEDFYDKE